MRSPFNEEIIDFGSLETDEEVIDDLEIYFD